MRNATLVAASLLLAGCTHTITGESQQTGTTTGSASISTAAPSAAKPPAPSSAPRPGATISDVIAWVETARAADATNYHSATRGGATTELGEDIAFSAAGGKVACMTDSRHTGDALTCLVDLADPPPPPSTVYGQWQGGWVDFNGSTLQIGSAHGDPGPFSKGDGPELPDGESLSFTDYRCRADGVGLVCVNYAHRSAVRLSTAGIEPFGCLKPVPPPQGAGKKFSC